MTTEKTKPKKIVTAKKVGTGAMQFGVSFFIGKLILRVVLKKFDVELEPITIEFLAGAIGSFINGVISGVINFWKMWIKPIIMIKLESWKKSIIDAAKEEK